MMLMFIMSIRWPLIGTSSRKQANLGWSQVCSPQGLVNQPYSIPSKKQVGSWATDLQEKAHLVWISEQLEELGTRAADWVPTTHHILNLKNWSKERSFKVLLMMKLLTYHPPATKWCSLFLLLSQRFSTRKMTTYYKNTIASSDSLKTLKVVSPPGKDQNHSNKNAGQSPGQSLKKSKQREKPERTVLNKKSTKMILWTIKRLNTETMTTLWINEDTIARPRRKTK